MSSGLDRDKWMAKEWDQMLDKFMLDYWSHANKFYQTRSNFRLK